MATLTGTKPKNTYKDLLQLPNSNVGMHASTLISMQDGAGNTGPFQLSQAVIAIQSGKTLQVLSGGIADILSGGSFRFAGTAISITAAQINDTPNKLKTGIHQLLLPARCFYTRTTNGAAYVEFETTTNDVMIPSFDFDPGATNEAIQFGFPAPKSWDESTVTAQFFWTATSGSGNVIWGIQGLARSDDDALDTAFGTAQEVTDTLIATNDMHVTSATAAMTFGGTPAEGDWLFLQVYRNSASASDTLTAADAKLIGVRLNFGIAAENDA